MRKEIVFIVILIFILFGLGIYFYTKNDKTKEKFIDFDKKNINQKELLDIIMKTTNNVLKNQQLKPQYKEYTRNLVKDFSIENINKLKNQKNQVKLSSRAKKIVDMNSTILKNNKNIKILVINNKRYIFDKKTNKKIREETLELFDDSWEFSGDYVGGTGVGEFICKGKEGPSPECPCDDPEKKCSRENLGMGYCCYGAGSSSTGKCSQEPCPDGWQEFFKSYLPKILYTIGATLVAGAVAVLLGIAVAGITIVSAPWVLAAGLCIIIGTAVYDYIVNETAEGSARGLVNTVKEVIKNMPETQTASSGLSIAEDFNNDQVDNVVVEVGGNSENSGISGNVGYIAGGRIPKSVLENLVQIYFSGYELKPINCTNVICNGSVKYGVSLQRNMEILKCCMEKIMNKSPKLPEQSIDFGQQQGGPLSFGCEQWKNFGICTNINDVYNLPFVVNTTGGAQMVDRAYRECCEQPPAPQTQECSSVCVYDPSTGKTIRNVMCDGRLTATFEDPSCCRRECRNGITYEICDNLDGQRTLNTGKRC